MTTYRDTITVQVSWSREPPQPKQQQQQQRQQQQQQRQQQQQQRQQQPPSLVNNLLDKTESKSLKDGFITE